MAAGRHHGLWNQPADQRYDFRLFLNGLEQLLDKGDRQHPVLPQYIGLGALPLRDFLKLELLAFAAQLRRVLVLLGDLNADQRLDQLMLLLGGRPRLFGFDALGLRLLLLLIGDLQLIGELLAQPRHDELAELLAHNLGVVGKDLTADGVITVMAGSIRSASGDNLTEESIGALSGGAGCAILGHAQRDDHRGYAGGSGALAVDHPGSQQPAEARVAGADHCADRRRQSAPLAIMRAVGKGKTVVWRWQERFMHEGVEGLTRDKTRPSRIPPLPAADRRSGRSR